MSALHPRPVKAESPLPLRRWRLLAVTGLVAATALALPACGDDGSTDPDAGARDGAAPDAATPDATPDAPPPLDAAPDAPAPDTGAPPGDPPELTDESGAFPLGIASGDVTTSGAILWTRYDGMAPLRLVVWEMDGDAYGRRVHDADAIPADGGFVHEQVDTLLAGMRYRYAFFEMDGDTRTGRSLIGRLRAAIADDAREPLIVGAVSCLKNGMSFATLERAGEREDLDVFLLLGDTTYNDGAETLGEYRGMWAENLSTDGYRGLRAATSVLATWDDHEVENDYDPERVPAEQMAAARAAFFENLPLRRDPEDADRIWRRARWGQTLEVFVLDSRGERLPSTRGDTDIYLSRAQMDWLKAGLADSTAVFKLVMSSVPIGDFPGVFDFPGSRNDRWEGYAGQRNEILGHVEDMGITGVIWVSGDFHLGSIGHVSPSGLGASAIEVLVGPGAQIGNPGALLLGPPQWEFATSTNNYTSFELDPDTGRVRVTFHEGDGDVLETREVTP